MCSRDRILGHQRLGCGEQFVEILNDDQGVDDIGAVMDQCRHQPVGIDRQIFRRQLIARKKIELVLGEFLALCMQGKSHLVTTDRLGRVVELEFL